MNSTKAYILDTNVLLHDPHALYKFEEHHVILPVEVLEELDRFKSDPSEKGRNARHVHRELKKRFGDSTAASMVDGADLPTGGKLSVLVNQYLLNTSRKRHSAGMKRLLTVFPDMAKMDNRILACTLFVAETSGKPATLVTKDINMLLKALAVDLRAEDYLNDKVKERFGENGDDFYSSIEISRHEMQRFGSEGEITLPATRVNGMAINEYALLQTSDGGVFPSRYAGAASFRKLALPSHLQPPGGIAIKPRNLEQQFLMDALLDPDISLVTCYGKAGTGKTIVSTACALHLMGQQQYEGVSISRPVISMGKEIGYLPGDINDKMMPWLQPYHDALNVIYPMHENRNPGFADKRVSRRPRKNAKKKASSGSSAQNGGSAYAKPYQELIASGLLEIEALTFIRGRSIPRRFFILDEAQQLTPHEVKTVVSRMSEGSKIILLGDPTQIDNPYVDSQSNGLVYAKNKLRDQSLASHVKLTKGERSPLAELAVTLM